jgi:regulatory protein
VSRVQRQRPPKSKPEPEASAAARALRLLSRRDYTRRELQAKLAPHVEDFAELHSLLDDFTARGWLSESRVVDQVVHAKRTRMGPARIRHALLRRGISEELIAPALATLRASELKTARALWARKFGSVRGSAADQARQVRFLQFRGFSVEVAMRVVRGSADDSGE